jgi:phytanoyl-CoA hydroxylase
MTLTPDQLSTFHRDGYLIIPSALSPSTISSLLAETTRLLSTLDLSTHPLTRFRTGGDTGQDHVGDAYFLGSGDKIRFFFEEDAFSSTGELQYLIPRAVNKIGHFLHGLSPPFASLLSPEDENEIKPAEIARSLGFKSPEVLQSMVIMKQPEIGGAVPPHQDSTFLYTNPPSAVGFWYALEDATIENGCLSFLPGSHLWAPITKRLVRSGEGTEGTEMVDNTGAQFPLDTEECKYSEERGEEDKKGEYVMGEVKAGSLVLIHGNLLHKSERNTSAKGRIIYTFHIIEGADGWEYDGRNWLQPPEGGFTKLFT